MTVCRVSQTHELFYKVLRFSKTSERIATISEHYVTTTLIDDTNLFMRL